MICLLYKDEVTIKQPSCKNCTYAINNGVNGCKIDKQDLEIKFGLKECGFYKNKY